MNNGSTLPALPMIFAGQVLVFVRKAQRDLCCLVIIIKKRPETLEDTCAQNAMLMNNFVYLQMMLTTLILSIVQPDKEFL